MRIASVIAVVVTLTIVSGLYRWMQVRPMMQPTEGVLVGPNSNQRTTSVWPPVVSPSWPDDPNERVVLLVQRLQSDPVPTSVAEQVDYCIDLTKEAMPEANFAAENIPHLAMSCLALGTIVALSGHDERTADALFGNIASADSAIRDAGAQNFPAMYERCQKRAIRTGYEQSAREFLDQFTRCIREGVYYALVLQESPLVSLFPEMEREVYRVERAELEPLIRRALRNAQ